MIFEIDARTNTVKRQIIQNFPTTDFAMSRDGSLFYILDGTGSIVRLVSVANEYGAAKRWSITERNDDRALARRQANLAHT